MKKCNLKQCLNNEKDRCIFLVPSAQDKIITNSIKCPFFDDDFQKTYKEWKNKGGVLGDLARMNGKKIPISLDESKEEKRKLKKEKKMKDKNIRKKRKEKNSLDELF